MFLASCFVSAQEQYPGKDIIGHGYDVFGRYANTKSITDYPIFNFSKVEKMKNGYDHNLPKFVKIKNISDHLIKTVEGSSKSEYITNLSQNMGLSGKAFFFKASIDNQFNEDNSSVSELLYYTYMDINTKWKVSLDIRNMDSLISYLDPQFKLDLNNLEPSELFELYGTHIIASAYLGGRIDYTTCTELNSNVSTTDVKTAIKAKYGMIQGNVTLGEGSKATLSKVKTQTKFNVIGGSSEYTTNLNHDQYESWAEGIKSKPVLCGFNDKSLMPIWLLTNDASRQEVLNKYFLEVLLPNNPLPNNFKPDPVLDNYDLTEEFKITAAGFMITKDCDYYYLTGDEAGEIKYSVTVKNNNNELIGRFKTPSGKHHSMWSGQFLTINESATFTLPLKESSSIYVFTNLYEEDDLKMEVLGEKKKIHSFPFSSKDLYNNEIDGIDIWQERLYKDSDCDGTFYYRIETVENNTAFDYGNKGWEEYKIGDYSQCLFYCKEALKLDNTLWFVQYNAALMYLINGNPRAIEKYQKISELCTQKPTIEAALDDIVNHEENFGVLSNSEPIKILLKSKL